MRSRFTEFLESEIERRSMTPRQFALAAGIDPTTITRALKYDTPHQPSMDVLVKLSKYTHVSLGTLIALAYPEAFTTSISSQLLAEQIESLPEAIRQTVVAIVKGAVPKDS
jgi:transcriptional regulator with XRE-family HTH domain